MINAAQEYAASGLYIFPITSRQKKPPLCAWREQSSYNPAQIDDWWRQYPTANIGLDCGRSKLIVIDIDSKEAGEKLKGKLPRTLTSRSARGWQAFFWMPEKPIGCRVGWREGVDVRGAGGYVLLPPSIHPSGIEYKWARDVAIAELSAWIRAELTWSPPILPRVGSVSTKAEPLVKAVSEAKQGNRNAMLYWAACSAAKEGHTIYSELIDAAVAVGLNKIEATNTVRSAFRRFGR